MWDLIVSVPDHCLSFYFALYTSLTLKESLGVTDHSKNFCTRKTTT